MRYQRLQYVRDSLSSGSLSIGTWMQIQSPEIAEILSSNGFDWVAIDLEHGCFSLGQLPNLFRSIELNKVLPLVRLPSHDIIIARQSLDAGAGGIIVPNVTSIQPLLSLCQASRWPPFGSRGVGYCRANLYGRNFDHYLANESQAPLLVAMLEHVDCLSNLDEILSFSHLDAVFIGPYDLSASLGSPGNFQNAAFLNSLQIIEEKSKKFNVPLGFHVVKPDPVLFRSIVDSGYKFIAYSIDSFFLNELKPPKL